MAKITVEQLMAKMANLEIDEEELATYFVVDEKNSSAFAPRLTLNSTTVQIPRGAEAAQRSAALMNGANYFARMGRRSKFHRKIGQGYDGPIIVSEGDSWFQYPILLKDTIDVLMDTYAVYSLGAAGDLLKRMADKQEYVRALHDTGASILLLSGGGNDLVAGGALASHLEEFHPDLMPADYLLPSFSALLDDALHHYGRMFRQVHQLFPHVSILCHGYDYPVPDNDRWLGKPMASRGINSKALQKAIAAEMMNDFNRRLRRLAASMPNVTYIDCRGVVGDHRWYDGLHPKNAGYFDVAKKFDHEIRTLANTRSGPTRIFSGPFGNIHDLKPTLMPTPHLAGGQPNGISLHLGLNTVDPNHYDGWDGALQACEADAHAMQALAEAEGFEPTLMLTSDATRQNTIDAIEKAAKDLQPGDMFLFTVSAHGGRIPDFNHDEDHDDPNNPIDETLCLYDFQLADDELYMLWSKFRAGVRVLMVPDTCHSGSMIKFGPALPGSLFGMEIEQPAGVRTMPPYIEERVWRANEATYREASRSYAALKESVMTAPLSSPVKASVLNLGACKDTQFAMDGAQNGAFTGALLEIWQGGNYKGDYRAFRDAIDASINSPSQTPQLFEELLQEPNFVTDRPFTLVPGATANASGHAPVSPVSPGPQRTADEGEERDDMPDAQVTAILSAKARGAGFRDSTAALNWSDYAEFDAFIRGLNLRNFGTDEFLILGGGHNTPGGPCAGKNTYPPRHLWGNIAKTAKVLDDLRDRLGKPIVITNAYRSPAYNACIGGASASQHMQFSACDFKVSGMDAPDVAQALRWMRDKEEAFKGGIGRYNSFTHVDTRGHNTTFPPAFRDSPLPSTAPLSARGPETLRERLDILSTVDLAPQPSARSVPKGARSFAEAVTRSGDSFDPNDEIATHQQSLQAAVNASSVISFVENLTPAQKEDVLLSTLFAQRAADKRVPDPVKNREDWYAVYMDMLTVMGWVTEAMPFTSSHKMVGNGSFDQVILGTLAQVATGNQFKIVESAIEALRGLTDDDGKIKLFDFETSRTQGGNFQIGSAEASGDVVSMALGAFNFSYQDRRQNILFVSWGKNELDYWLSARTLSLSPTAYAEVRELVKSRLAETRKKAIMDIEI